MPHVLRRLPALASVALAFLIVLPASAGAAIISLTGGPVTGTASTGQVIDVVVALDMNGFQDDHGPASNVVSHQLWVGFSGLSFVSSSLGTDPGDPPTTPAGVYSPDGLDVLDISGPDDPDASYTPGCSPQCDFFDARWQSLALVTPSPLGLSVGLSDGTLFTLRLSVLPGATSWSLDVFGDPDFSLLWEPEGQCPELPPGDPDTCTVYQYPVAFQIVDPTSETPGDGVARVVVSLDVPPSPPVGVPEPGMPLLLSIGTGLVAARLRRRR